MNAPNVLPAVEQRGCCPVVFPLSTERVGEPREPAILHSQTEIGPLDNRRAHARRIGLAHDWDYLDGLQFCGAVPLLSVLECSVDLNQLRVAGDVVMQSVADS